MQMIVPGCEECIGYNLAIYEAEAVADVEFAYGLETDLATHNETHTESENDTRVSCAEGLRMAGVLV